MKEKPIYEQLGYDPDPPFYASKPVITNYDRFIRKTPEELAKTLADYVSCHDCPIPFCKVRFTMNRLGCIGNWLEYLKQEASDD